MAAGHADTMKCVNCLIENIDKDAITVYLGKSLCREHFIENKSGFDELQEEIKQNKSSL